VGNVITHRSNCRGPKYIIEQTRGETLPYLVMCSEVLGGCGVWSHMTKKTAFNIPRHEIARYEVKDDPRP
jgi:hypothetical protein